MNLIEARKIAHEGWVRSPSRTEGMWLQLRGFSFSDGAGKRHDGVSHEDLDADDWEPKPAPAEPFETMIWLSPEGPAYLYPHIGQVRNGWRKIRVREVTE